MSHPKDDGEPWERFSESRPNSLAGAVFKNQVLNNNDNNDNNNNNNNVIIP